MIIKVDNEIELKQLEQSDSIDIFKMIDNQREYLGKWLPFVASTKELSDTEKYVDSVFRFDIMMFFFRYSDTCVVTYLKSHCSAGCTGKFT